VRGLSDFFYTFGACRRLLENWPCTNFLAHWWHPVALGAWKRHPYPCAGRFTEFSDGAIVSHLIASGLFNSMANRGWIRLFHNVWVKKQDGDGW